MTQYRHDAIRRVAEGEARCVIFEHAGDLKVVFKSPYANHIQVEDYHIPSTIDNAATVLCDITGKTVYIDIQDFQVDGKVTDKNGTTKPKGKA